MTTCRDIITLGLQMARIVPLGQTPTDTEAATGLDVLQGIYDGWFANSLFGTFKDVYKTDAYTAEEFDRVTNSGGTITIPTTIVDEETGLTRAPRDLAAIVVIASGAATNRVYSGGAWRVCSGLTLGSTAPLADRNVAGLAAYFAHRYAETFGVSLGPAQQRMAQQFVGSLMWKPPHDSAEYF